jgi:hypothetical protein
VQHFEGDPDTDEAAATSDEEDPDLDEEAPDEHERRPRRNGDTGGFPLSCLIFFALGFRRSFWYLAITCSSGISASSYRFLTFSSSSSIKHSHYYF